MGDPAEAGRREVLPTSFAVDRLQRTALGRCPVKPASPAKEGARSVGAGFPCSKPSSEGAWDVRCQHQPSHDHREPDEGSRVANDPRGRAAGLRDANRGERSPQERGGVGRSPELLRRRRLGRAREALQAVPEQGPRSRHRRPAGVERVEDQGGRQPAVGPDRRRHDPVLSRPQQPKDDEANAGDEPAPSVATTDAPADSSGFEAPPAAMATAGADDDDIPF